GPPCRARAPPRSRARPRARRRAGRATASLSGPFPAARPASDRSSAGGCAGRGCPRTGAGGSSRPPRPPPASGRPAAAPIPSPPPADAGSRPGRIVRRAPGVDGRCGGANRLPASREAYDSDVIRPFVGVRWWLGAAFAVVAATSTAIVVSQFSDSSENAFRHNAEDVVLTDVQRAAKGTPASLARRARQLNGD